MNERRAISPTAHTAGIPLSPKRLKDDFGRKACLTQAVVPPIYAALRESPNEVADKAFADWQTTATSSYGQQTSRLAAAVAQLAKSLAIPASALDAMAVLFSLQTYYALLVKTFIRQIHLAPLRSACGDCFDWAETIQDPAVTEAIRRIVKQFNAYDIEGLRTSLPGNRDWLKDLYEDLFAKPVRHALGEYYTPDWLATHVLDQSGYSGDPQTRLLDPACGSGTFLVAAINRLRGWMEKGTSNRVPNNELCRQILDNIVGFDLNPLAVLSARANYLLALGELAEQVDPNAIPVYQRDSILTPVEASAKRFDFVVGNPPWIAWDDLPTAYREATKPLWEQYGLFSLSANEARHGGGKKDLSMLMLYRTADQHLADGGRLAMVITQTLFQTKGAGDGFRRFQLGNTGSSLRVLRVDDLVERKPFAAANWTSTIMLEKGKPTDYPVPYFRWRAKRAAKATDNPIAYEAEPIDPQRPTSPWFLRPKGFSTHIHTLTGPSDYQAHLGANTGGANGVFWLQLLEPVDSGVCVRNLVSHGRRSNDLEEVETVLEPDLLYPLLRWGDVTRYHARPSAHLLLVQDPMTRRGIEEKLLRQQCPRTYDYLKRFEPQLVRRAAYRRYQQQGPFYSMYDIDHYSLAPVKVVWRRMDRRINAAVVEPWEDPCLGLRPIVPQETCVLIACTEPEEAHYLCALFNSAMVGFLVGSHHVRGGKGFGTPGMLEVLRLRRFDPINTDHCQLAALSRQAHDAAAKNQSVEKIQEQIDLIASRLWQLKEKDLAILQREMHAGGQETPPLQKP